MHHLQKSKAAGEIVTGVLHVDREPDDLHANLNTLTAPFNKLTEKELCPGSPALEKFNASHR
jgi:2-oxoglutarate ferredoxin oxidoreductase subunit beta